jgi:hypothetical protein
MKIEFDHLKYPMPVNDDTINFFRKLGNTFFLLIKEKREEYVSGIFDAKTYYEEKIVTMTIHPGFALLNREFVNFGDWSDTKIIGYCKLEFPDNVSVCV